MDVSKYLKFFDEVNKMKNLVVRKTRVQDLLTEFIAGINVDELRLEIDKKSFIVRQVEKTSVLDILSSQAEDLGPEDMSINVDCYLYGLPKRK
jgi:hypothetical protein